MRGLFEGMKTSSKIKDFSTLILHQFKLDIKVQKFYIAPRMICRVFLEQYPPPLAAREPVYPNLVKRMCLTVGLIEGMNKFCVFDPDTAPIASQEVKRLGLFDHFVARQKCVQSLKTFICITRTYMFLACNFAK